MDFETLYVYGHSYDEIYEVQEHFQWGNNVF